MDDASGSHTGESAAPRQAEAPAGAAPGKSLSDSARRALAEAAERRAEVDRRAAAIEARPERNGRGGLEPVRYEDWEIGGRAVDF